ncbi:hypothetical protein [Kineococcus sp. SYSU DK006]|uniref:hypothetical protein n=1 Tax=Kineococcus sp. SYSU DK006 TaxID=3383127 RepID=UPI003D7E76EB
MVEELDERTCRVRMATDDLDRPLVLLGAIGADFDVTSPPELLARASDWARRFTRAQLTATPPAGAGSTQSPPPPARGPRR